LVSGDTLYQTTEVGDCNDPQNLDTPTISV
jgi:hypothetical protein